MKKINLIISIALFFTSAAFSGEKYDASIKAKTNRGQEKTFTFRLVLDDPKAEQLTGELMSYGSGPCGVERKITGQQKSDGEVQFQTGDGDVQGCGKLIFKGRRNSDSEIVGSMRFQGEVHEFLFKK